MKKKSNLIISHWPKIYQLLKSPPTGISLGNFPALLPGMDKIKIDPSYSGPQAVGYVTTEDTNHDGKLDTLHINSEEFLRQLRQAGITDSDLSNLVNLDKRKLGLLLSAFVEVISHEMGHIKDFKGDGENPFPGGESVADSAGRSALNQINYLKDLSSTFKSLNLKRESNKLDLLIKKMSM